MQVHRLDILDKYLKSPDSAIDKELENLLFIYVPEMGKCSGQLIKISYNIMRPWLKKFISDNNINDANGKPYNLNSHQFRRTLGTDMHSKGIEINIIQKVLGHSFATTTNQYYVDAKDKERECPQFESRASLPKAFDWNRSKLYPFLRRWNISDKYGDVYYFSSHSFRPTFVRELIKKGIKIGFIQKQFDHTTIEMTCHYLQLEEDEIKGIYSEMLLIPESKIAGIRANEIKQELSSMFEGKTSIEIQEITKDLVSSMQFNTLPTGVCLYDVRRGNCTDGDGCFMYNCPNYLTEIQFYPLLKKELEVLELEMRRYKEQGRERDFQRQYIKWKYLKPLVDGLEIQL